MEEALLRMYLASGLSLTQGRSFDGESFENLLALAAHVPSLNPEDLAQWGERLVQWERVVRSDKPAPVPTEPLAAVKRVKREFIAHAESTASPI